MRSRSYWRPFDGLRWSLAGRVFPFLVLLFVGACATSAQNRALNWAPVSPPPRPGVGAPLVGQPGRTRPAPLLKTEPPFKAAKAPEPAPNPVVLGVKIPISNDELEAYPVNQCLAHMHKTLEVDAPRRAIINAAKEAKRRCIIFSLLAGCLLEAKSDVEFAQNKGGMRFYGPAIDALGRMQGLAQRRENRACSGVYKTFTPAEHDAWVQLSRTLGVSVSGEIP